MCMCVHEACCGASWHCPSVVTSDGSNNNSDDRVLPVS